MPQSSVLRRNVDDANIMLENAHHVYIKDKSGKSYLDGISGAMVSSLGYGNEEIIDVISSQAKKLSYSHNARYTNEAQEYLASQLSSLLTNKYKVYFCGSGSEVIDAAIRVQYAFHKCNEAFSKNKIISFNESYHGSSIGALNLSGAKRVKDFYQDLFKDNLCIVDECISGDCGDSNQNCLCKLEETMDWSLIGSILFEPISANVLGAKLRSKKTIEKISLLKNKYGFLTIVDEIATGISRTGRDFSYQYHDLFEPDIICISKILGAGYTNIGCLLVKNSICNILEENKVNLLGHTYNGNPIACAVGSKVLEILGREKYSAVNAQKGSRLKQQLENIKNECDFIFDVRGFGLLIAIEFRDNGTKIQQNFIRKVFSLLMDDNLITLWGTGDYSGRGDHLLLAPAYTYKDNDYENLISILKRVLSNDKLHSLIQSN